MLFGPGVSAYALAFLNLLMRYVGNLDFQISARFSSSLTPFAPGVSALAFTFSEIVNALCWYHDFESSADFGPGSRLWVPE